MALFVAAYGLFWIIASAALLLASSWGSTTLAAIAIAAWQCSPWKQRALNRSHAHTELAAFGVKADLDALRFGFVHAVWCATSCWALMLLPMLFTRGHLIVMAGVTLWLAGERLERPQSPRWRWRGPMAVLRIAAGQARSWMQPYGPVASRARM
jgi:predicted metal-binding membrane protein